MRQIDMTNIASLLTIVASVLRVFLLLAVALSATVLTAAEPSRLEVKPVNGAPGWLLDGKPYVPIQAQAGRSQAADVHGSVFLRDGKAVLRVDSRIQLKAPKGFTFASSTRRSTASRSSR